MTCDFCLQRPAYLSRRCPDCHGYLESLMMADDPMVRAYGWTLCVLAARYRAARYGCGPATVRDTLSLAVA